MTQLDENGNPITTDVDNEGAEWTETEDDDTDYKSLYEKEKADKERYERNFKKTAKELNERKKSEWTPINVDEVVSKQIGEQMFYMNNAVAKEYEKEIKEIQSKTGMTPEDAYTFYLAKNKPELIGKKVEVWVDWVSKTVEEKKDYKDMSYEELRPNQKKRGE